MRKSQSRISTCMRRSIALTACLLPLGLGCTNFALTDLLSPTLVAELSNTASPASLPGTAQTVLVTFENRLDNPCRFEISYRTVNDQIPPPIMVTLGNDVQFAQAIACPVLEITVGDITDISEPGVFVGLAGQTDNDPFIAVEPFGVLLREGINYECGDGITFVLLESQATASGFRILAFIESAS